MKIRFGYELVYSCAAARADDLMLHAHPSRLPDLLVPDQLVTDPALPLDVYMDGFGNTCTRILAPAGGIRLTADALIQRLGRARARVRTTRRSIRSNRCRTRRSCICSAAAIARPSA
jgi:hypothetical protein